MTATLFAEPESTSKSAWITAHCDGGSRGNPGPAGFGVVVTDEEGRLLAELSEFLGRQTNNFAEYSGLLACLEWALQHGHSRMRVISDSELMVNQIKGRYKVNSPGLLPLWEEARRRIAQFDAFQITHALRHKNQDADRLANEAMDRGTGRAPSLSGGKSDRTATSKAGNNIAAKPADSKPAMLRGFTRGGAIHLLGDASLPDGIFVKVIPE
jgi:ribonuclease HI